MQRRSLLRRFITAATALTLALAMGSAFARSAPLEESGRVQLPAVQGTPSLDKTRTALVKAAVGLNYTLESDKPGVLQIKYAKGDKFFVILEVSYDASGYEIKYKDSQGLNYDAEKRTIHPNVNKWIANLVKKTNATYAVDGAK
jgi:hypothetical protein